MNKFRIALIHPAYKNIVQETLSIPLGLAWLSAYLIEFDYSVSCYDYAISNDIITKQLCNSNDLIGIQLHSIENLDISLNLAREFKKCNDNIVICVGGLGATFLYKDLANYDFIDFIIVGEGELTIKELADTLSGRITKSFSEIKGLCYKENDNFVFTGNRDFVQDLDKFPLPNRNSFEIAKYSQWSIVTTRGCPYHCSFCVIPNLWNNKIRFRSPENIFKEIIQLAEIYKMRKFFILDDVFSVNKNRAKELMNLLLNSNYKFEWACLTRADCIDEELLVLFKQAGCTTISYGVESANQDTLNLLHKNISIEQIKKAVLLTKKVGIRVRCSFIFGFPNENKIHLENNINFILQTLPDEVQIYPLFPYLGTEICNDINPNDLLNSDYTTWKKDALNPIIQSKELSRTDIINSVKKCVNSLVELDYLWLSTQNKKPGKYKSKKTVMTEFSPIQSLDNE